MDTPLWGLRVDGAAARGLWPPAGSGLHRFRSGGDSACGAEGGGLPCGAQRTHFEGALATRKM